MKKKNGFVFIETIITIVFLAASLLLLFSSYQNAIVDEKNSVYYDDISYLYRNYYLADFLINKTEITKKEEEMFANKYIYDVQSVVEDETKNSDLYSTYQQQQKYPAELKKLVEEFNVNNMLIVSDKIITECYDNNESCTKSYDNIDADLANYIKAMKIDSPEEGEEKQTEYYLVTEYREKDTDEGITKCDETTENCSSFYVTLKLDIATGIKKGNTIAEVCEGQQFGECIEDNYDIENNDEAGIYHHDGDPSDSGSDKEAEDDSYRYAGASEKIKNYICLDNNATKVGKCGSDNANLYRIIGVFNHKLKVIKEIGENNNWTQTDILNNLGDLKNIVENSEWKIGGFNLTGDAKAIYDAEVKKSIVKRNSESGLMYVSDYMYGASPKYWSYQSNKYNEAKQSNWLYQNQEEWLISPVLNTSNKYKVKNDGSIAGTTSKKLMSRGSMYLKDTVVLVSGKGTKEEPYRIRDIGVVIDTLKGEAGYHEITAKVSIWPEDEKIVKYFYSIYKDGVWSKWVEANDDTYIFTELLADTDYRIKARVLNNHGNYSDEVETSVTTKYDNPKLTVEAKTSDGKITNDQWINKDITVEVKGSGNINDYDIKYCRSNNSCEPNANGKKVVDTSEGEENICFKAISKGSKKTESAIACFKTKLDKTSPTCNVSTSSNNITITGADSMSGLDCVSDDNYNNCELPTNKFKENKVIFNGLSDGEYKYRSKDNAGNYSEVCSVTISTHIGETSECREVHDGIIYCRNSTNINDRTAGNPGPKYGQFVYVNPMYGGQKTGEYYWYYSESYQCYLPSPGNWFSDETFKDCCCKGTCTCGLSAGGGSGGGSGGGTTNCCPYGGSKNGSKCSGVKGYATRTECERSCSGTCTCAGSTNGCTCIYSYGAHC